MKYQHVVVLLLLFTVGCNFSNRGEPAFIAPSDFQETITPDWAATLQAAEPPQETPLPTEAIATTEQSVKVTVEVSPTVIVPDTATAVPVTPGPILYYTQAGDTLDALAVRFGVFEAEIESTTPLPRDGFINPNQLVIIPQRYTQTTSPEHLLPDSEFVYTLSAIDFDVEGFVAEADGYLKNHHEFLGTHGEMYGAAIIKQVALDNSVNPRLLLALLEYQSGWVFGQPETLSEEKYPLGEIDISSKGLLRQLKWAVNQLSVGYYGWREGRLNKIEFSDGSSVYLAPDLNAGTVALQYYLAQVYDRKGWELALNPDVGVPALYEELFGNPWNRARVVEPLFPAELTQPDLELPFLFGRTWSYTGGPHGAWEKDGSWAAIDFAPEAAVSGCVESNAWVAAAADGVIARSERGIVVLDLDGDGFEQTGWVLVYLHIADEGRTGERRVVKAGDVIGHPSCEGGYATGTHVHVARKYNGEWMEADGPIPFTLDGWVVHSSGEPYKGTLTRNGEVIKANQYGAHESQIQAEQLSGDNSE